MVFMADKLSHEDIKALMDNPTAEVKIRVIEKLSGQYNSKDFSEAQIRLAEQIFRLLLKQAEIEVRKALAENLMYSKAVPHDVVLSLARDVEEVSTPVLEFSEVLTENDLVEIIKSTEKVACHLAVSRRNNVPEKVSDALIDTKNADVVDSLIQNDNARISKKGFEKVVENFSSSEKIVDSMITRGSIPNTIIEQMTVKVSKAIQQKLEKKYKNNFKEINNFFQESGEVAALRFMSMQTVDKDLVELVDQLEKENRLLGSLHPINGQLTQLLDGIEQLGQLTPLSALAVGHLTLFEISLSRLTGVPYENIKKLVADKDAGFEALYHRAQLPTKLFDAVHFIVGVIQQMEKDHLYKGTARAKDSLHLMAKKIMTDSQGKKIPNLAHFISVIRHHIERSQGEW